MSRKAPLRTQIHENSLGRMSNFTDFYGGLPPVTRTMLTMWLIFAVGLQFFVKWGIGRVRTSPGRQLPRPPPSHAPVGRVPDLCPPP